jgi:uncharacterized protein YmfQ (DUF2313 family)
MTEITRDRHIRRSGEPYANAFLSLLPTGQAWPKHVIDSVLVQTVYGLCDYWGYVDGRAADLLEIESDPRKTIELLPDWERNWGLPDPCYAAPKTIDARHVALIQRMTMLGSASRQFFIDVVATYTGRHITISEYRPWMVGVDVCGDGRIYGNGHYMHDSWNRPILNENGTPLALGEISEWPNYGLGPLEVRYYWRVHIGDAKLTRFHVSTHECGIDPLLWIDRALDIECLLVRWKPAHTEIVWDYSHPDIPIELCSVALISGPAEISTGDGVSIVYTWFRCGTHLDNSISQCGIDPHLKISYQTEIGHLRAQPATINGIGSTGSVGSGCLKVAVPSATISGNNDAWIEGHGDLFAFPAHICAAAEMHGCQIVFSQDLFSELDTVNSVDLSNCNVRIVLDETLFVGVPEHTEKIRIRLVASTDYGFTIDAAWFGQRALVGEVYDMTSCISQVLFDGSPSVTVGPGEVVVSDEIDFHLLSVTTYVLAVHFAAGGTRTRTLADANCWYKPGADESSVCDVTGYGQLGKNTLFLVDRIDACPGPGPDLPPPDGGAAMFPFSLAFVGTGGDGTVTNCWGVSSVSLHGATWANINNSVTFLNFGSEATSLACVICGKENAQDVAALMAGGFHAYSFESGTRTGNVPIAVLSVDGGLTWTDTHLPFPDVPAGSTTLHGFVLAVGYHEPTDTFYATWRWNNSGAVQDATYSYKDDAWTVVPMVAPSGGLVVLPYPTGTKVCDIGDSIPADGVEFIYCASSGPHQVITTHGHTYSYGGGSFVSVDGVDKEIVGMDNPYIITAGEAVILAGGTNAGGAQVQLVSTDGGNTWNPIADLSGIYGAGSDGGYNPAFAYCSPDGVGPPPPVLRGFIAMGNFRNPY